MCGTITAVPQRGIEQPGCRKVLRLAVIHGLVCICLISFILRLITSRLISINFCLLCISKRFIAFIAIQFISALLLQRVPDTYEHSSFRRQMLDHAETKERLNIVHCQDGNDTRVSSHSLQRRTVAGHTQPLNRTENVIHFPAAERPHDTHRYVRVDMGTPHSLIPRTLQPLLQVFGHAVHEQTQPSARSQRIRCRIRRFSPPRFRRGVVVVFQTFFAVAEPHDRADTPDATRHQSAFQQFLDSLLVSVSVGICLHDRQQPCQHRVHPSRRSCVREVENLALREPRRHLCRICVGRILRWLSMLLRSRQISLDEPQRETLMLAFDRHLNRADSLVPRHALVSLPPEKAVRHRSLAPYLHATVTRCKERIDDRIGASSDCT
eukprot:1546625-Rhodomonas_salina.1